MATKDMKNQLLKDYEAKIAEVNRLIATGTNAEVEGKLAELSNIEKEYRSLLEKEVFVSLPDVHEALMKHHFETIAHKKISEDGRMTGVEKSTKNVQIDLRRFCEFKSFDLAWFYEMQALNKRLTLRVAMELGVKPEEIKAINNSYSMDKLAEEIELGKTPTSTTQIVKHIQKVLDTLSPEEGKVNNHDLAYILACYTKKNNKAALRVICSKHTILQSLLMDVFHRVVTNGVYSVDFKKATKVTEPPKDTQETDGTKKGSGKTGTTKKSSGKTGTTKKGSGKTGTTKKVEAQPTAEVLAAEPVEAKKEEHAA